MERLAAKGGPTGGEITPPSDGKEAENVAFVQCAGSRDPNHLSYCSSVCCSISLKQVAYLRSAVADSQAFVVYKDLRTPGQYEQYYRNAQNDEGVFLTKGEIVEVKEKHLCRKHLKQA